MQGERTVGKCHSSESSDIKFSLTGLSELTIRLGSFWFLDSEESFFKIIVLNSNQPHKENTSNYIFLGIVNDVERVP